MKALLILFLSFPVLAFELELSSERSRCVVQARWMEIRTSPEGPKVYSAGHMRQPRERHAFCALYEQTRKAAERAGPNYVVVLNTSREPEDKYWVTISPEGATVPNLVARVEDLEERIKCLERN